MMTPKRNPHPKMPHSCPISENANPNLLNSTPCRRPIKSPSSLDSVKKSKKSAPKTHPPPTPLHPSDKKSSRKKSSKNPNPKRDSAVLVDPVPYEADESTTASGVCELEGSSKVRKMKSLMLEEAMSGIPEPGAGRVMHLVRVFERLLSIQKEPEGDELGFARFAAAAATKG